MRPFGAMSLPGAVGLVDKHTYAFKDPLKLKQISYINIFTTQLTSEFFANRIDRLAVY